jgi:hypothetical protein
VKEKRKWGEKIKKKYRRKIKKTTKKLYAI